MFILIGSRALKHWYPDAREPHDWDYFSDREMDPAENTDVFTDPRLFEWDWNYGLSNVASPDELYTIKLSHSAWEVNHSARNWDKHAGDIIFMQRKGCELIPELYDLLLPVWKDKYDRRRISTHKSKDKFFADNVHRLYDHDSLHDSVAYGKRPMYTYILADGETVKVDNDKFWSMHRDDQLRLVREEIYVTALERILIPGNYQGSPGAAYWWALRRTATSLFKNKWSLFLMTHLDELRKPDCDYMQRHLDNKHKLVLN